MAVFVSRNESSDRLLADASSQIYELWQREGLQGFTGMRFDNDKGEVILYWKGQVPHRMVALVRTLRTSVPVRVVERPYSLVGFSGKQGGLSNLISPGQASMSLRQDLFLISQE